jgi:hypothetical protein
VTRRFIGVDLTSAFSARPRAVDLAVLDDALTCTFARATWPAAALVEARDAGALAAMLADAVGPITEDDVLAIDGPQALAEAGQTVRACERLLCAPGRTPDTLPDTLSRRPFASFIRSSLDLFAALLARRPAPRLGGAIRLEEATLFEVFPGAEWSVLARRRLAKKSSSRGRAERRALFAAAGVHGLPDLPTPDQSDALAGAFVAWRTRHDPGSVTLTGTPAYADAAGLREGCILHATAEVGSRTCAPAQSSPST